MGSQQRTTSRKEIVHTTKARIINAKSLIIVMDITNSGLGPGAYGRLKIRHKDTFPMLHSAHQEFMSTPMPHLTSLHIKLEYSWIDNLGPNCTMNLSCIEITLHLKRFGISISMDRDILSKWLPPIIDKEARLLARVFVGTDYFLEVEANVCDWAPVEGLTLRAGLLVAWTFVRNDKE